MFSSFIVNFSGVVYWHRENMFGRALLCLMGECINNDR